MMASVYPDAFPELFRFRKGLSEPELKDWFARPSWTPAQSVDILLGHRPVYASHQLRMSLPSDHKPKCYDLFASCSSSLPHFVKEDLLRLMPLELTPTQTVQALHDLGYLFENKLQHFLIQNDLMPSYRETGFVMRHFRYWAAADLWTLQEAVMLILGLDPFENRHFYTLFEDILEEYQRRRKVEVPMVFNLIQRSLCSNHFPLKRESLTAPLEQSLVEPVRFIRWAIDKQLNPPTELADLLGISIPIPKIARISTSGAQTLCRKWLNDKVENSSKDFTKATFRSMAMDRFPGLSHRGFDQVWKSVTNGTSWQKPGRIRL